MLKNNKEKCSIIIIDNLSLIKYNKQTYNLECRKCLKYIFYIK